MARWQVIKNSVPVALCNTIEEAEAHYAKYDCDEIRRIDDDNYQEGDEIMVRMRRHEPNPIWEN